MIKMFSSWTNIVISDINWIMYVPPGTGKITHTNRPFHGIVLNDEGAERDYYFSDGTVLKTRGNDLFYLPKGSSYYVTTTSPSGCYAINIEADINDIPFSVNFRNADQVRKIFKKADKIWLSNPSYCKISSIKSAYDIIVQGCIEEEKKYTPTAQEKLIFPAIEMLSHKFTDNSLSVSSLSKECGISEAYFRRIFTNKYGVSPKEYIINLRINYAKNLLKYGELSIEETAISCGFTEACHFSREFKKRTGISPKKFLSNQP